MLLDLPANVILFVVISLHQRNGSKVQYAEDPIYTFFGDELQDFRNLQGFINGFAPEADYFLKSCKLLMAFA